MKIAVTGASGFLGSHIVRELSGRGHNVRALVLPNDPAPGLRDLAIQTCPGDVLRPNTLPPALRDCEAVVHAAGRVNLRPTGRRAMHELHCEGTRNIVAAAQAAGVRRILYISSAGVLGALARPGLISEASPAPAGPANQRHHYHRSKIEAEKIFFTECGNLEALAVLPSMLWGPGDWRLSSTGYALHALKGGTLFYVSPGGTCALDVEDAARGAALALEKGQPGARYLLAGENITVERMCRLIAQAVGPATRVQFVPRMALYPLAWVGETLAWLGMDLDFSLDLVRQTGNYWWLDGHYAQAELGFAPRFSAEQAIARSVAWMRDFYMKRSL
jgi:dihydroflavonol-4-reductase